MSKKKYRLYVAPFLNLPVMIRRWFPVRYPLHEDVKVYQDAVSCWVERLSERSSHKGIPAGYHLQKGVCPPYGETTGYLISSLLRHYDDDDPMISGQIEWLCSCQNEEGWFTEPKDKGAVVIFNHGMMMDGLITYYQNTRRPDIKKCLDKAAQCLLNAQEDDGSWIKYAWKGTAVAYHARVALQLIRWGDLSDQRFSEAGKKNLDWVVTNIGTDGWIDRASFNAFDPTFLHTIAYTLEGLIQSARILNEKKYYMAVERTMERLLRMAEIRKRLPPAFDGSWKRWFGRSRPITPYAQLAAVFYYYYWITEDIRYVNAALKLSDEVKRVIDLYSRNHLIRGAVPCSNPSGGIYQPWLYANWSAKFALDMFQEEVLIKKHVKNIWIMRSSCLLGENKI